LSISSNQRQRIQAARSSSGRRPT